MSYFLEKNKCVRKLCPTRKESHTKIVNIGFIFWKRSLAQILGLLVAIERTKRFVAWGPPKQSILELLLGLRKENEVHTWVLLLRSFQILDTFLNVSFQDWAGGQKQVQFVWNNPNYESILLLHYYAPETFKMWS